MADPLAFANDNATSALNGQ
ncbi:hypothetical protein CCACVL1_08196 [Corchorus capsularis]|uniref:Uncharacterized protein n=1 Tax=Corchorus capsularis TaxID=210143 RepID=A0A1R3J1U8_COCAP|nr:hypothetical protein CCACVL1_08196 [Corchorus capsularis]